MEDTNREDLLAVIRRVGVLESRLRIITFIAATLAILLVFVAGVAAVGSYLSKDVIQTQRLDIVDAQGKPHMTLETDDHGYPLLRLGGTGGIGRIVLGLHLEGTPALGIFSQDGRSQVVFTFREDGSPQIIVMDKGKRQNVVLSSEETKPGRAIEDLR